jgi:hypothetical protein
MFLFILKRIGRAIYNAWHALIGRHFHYHANGKCVTKAQWWKHKKLENANLTYNSYLQVLEYMQDKKIPTVNARNGEYTVSMENEFAPNLIEQEKKRVEDRLELIVDDGLEKLGFPKEGPADIIKEYLLETKSAKP